MILPLEKSLVIVPRDLEPLRSQLNEAKLRLDFANNYLNEVQGDGFVGPDHDEALQTALRAIAGAKRNYSHLLERFNNSLDRSNARSA